MSNIIKTLEISDKDTIAEDHTKSPTFWLEERERIEKETKGYDLKEMCKQCIQKQYALGHKDEYGNPKLTISCTGLENLESALPKEVYEVVKQFPEEELKLLRETHNALEWLGNNIPDEKIFSPRPYQKMIASCSAKRKVLRMGRRCVEANETVVTEKKNITAKHLWHLYKHHKRMPKLVAYDDTTGELLLTDQYVIVPNGINEVYKVTTNRGNSTTITSEHPLLVWHNKQYGYIELENLIVGEDSILNLQGELELITSITKVGKKQTYHLSVIKYETFATGNGILHHNTGKTFVMTVGILHRLLTKVGSKGPFRVLMVAPMDTMIAEVVEQIKRFCDALPTNPIVSSKQSPTYEIVFNTGASFKGVTAGASGAKGVRGKGADLLYIDECMPKGTLIKVLDKGLVPIESIKVGDRVQSFDVKKKCSVYRRVTATTCSGINEVYTYTTVSGRKLTCTPNHPVLSTKGWVEIDKAEDIATINTRAKSNYFYESIIKSQYKNKEETYNLAVEGTQNYIVDGFVTHNCDFLRPQDLTSILGILMESKDVEFWASSTPIGETNLYKLQKDKAFKEFHFPSYVSPNYTQENDDTMRGQMTDSGYEQEVRGEFGSDDSGAYPIEFLNKYVDGYVEGQTETQYRTLNRSYNNNPKQFITVMGVDWNGDKTGTRIFVVAYDKSTGLYGILDKAKVSKAGWTQQLAVEKVVELNRKYVCDHIYVDEGYGAGQTSQLRQFSVDQRGNVSPDMVEFADLRLSKVKAVSFGSSLEFHDPISGDTMRKQTKQFIVETSVELLSRGYLRLHVDFDSDIIAQMKNYIIKSKSANGLKVFTARDKKIGDHDLDAYNIALYGFSQEYPMFTTVSAISRTATNSPTAEKPIVMTASSSIIINTRSSMMGSKFRTTNRPQRAFKKRKSW